MAKLPREEREGIARKRLVSVLGRHGVANARTLEQKISDAGPAGQRIDPHILTGVRNELVSSGRLISSRHANAPWFHLAETPAEVVEARLEEQLSVYHALNHGSFGVRLGQVLEIAAYRALVAGNVEFFGRFKDLDLHDDSEVYKKEEPPQHIGSRSLDGNERLDFIVRHPSVGYLGLECKNVREWLYPDREEVVETLRKCLALDCVPVLIARRIPYVTFLLLTTCGLILHQTYNQLLPGSDTALADRARDKTLLGYHDIRTGNIADARLVSFVTTSLATAAPAAREKFEAYKDLLGAFATGEIAYSEFAGRVRRRSLGKNEDNDWEPGPPPWAE